MSCSDEILRFQRLICSLVDDLALPLRLFVYTGPYPKEREEGQRYERREKLSKRSRLQLVQKQ